MVKARGLTPRQEGRRHRILSAARDMLSEYGYEGTVMSKVAQRAGVSPTTLYNLYNTKDELLLEALRELAASFDSEIAPLLIEVEGRTLKLEGSAEIRFAEWRRLLREIFAEETGFPLDPDTGRVMPEPSPES